MRKIISLLLVLVMIIIMCACGNTENDYVEIEFYHQIGTDVETNKQLFDDIIVEFEKANPGIKVKHICLPVEQTWTVLSSRIQNNDTPDVFNGWFDTEEFKLMESGVVRDLTDSYLCDYIDPTILEHHTLNGKNYILPMTLNFTGVYYNVDLFDKYNISIPTTIDEFWTVCEAFKAVGIIPISAGDKDGWNLGYSSQNIMEYLMPDCIDEFPKIFDGSLKVTDMNGISEFADFIINRSKYVQEGALGADSDAMLSYFVNQEAAMMFDGANWMPTLNSVELDFKYAMFPMPGKAADDTKIMVNGDISLLLSASSTDEKQKAAEKFVDYLLTKGAEYYVDKTDCPSAVKNVSADATHYELIAKSLANGHTFKRPIAGHWADASFMDYQVALKNLTVSGNKEAFYTEVERALLTYGKPGIYLE